MFNPQATATVTELLPGHPCLILDDALIDPERLVALATEHRSAFAESPTNAYPGPELRLPDPITAALDAFLAPHLRPLFHLRRTLDAYSRLAIATKRPEALQPRQWIPHRDRLPLQPDQRILGSVLYLFHDQALGGTAFYRPRYGEAETARLVHDSGVQDPEEFTARYRIPRGYTAGTSDWFEQVAEIPPRWNRLIAYEGTLFHCSAIGHPERLTDDPASGRLTMNGFFVCRSAATSTGAPSPSRESRS